jgi:hypothetical protein
MHFFFLRPCVPGLSVYVCIYLCACVSVGVRFFFSMHTWRAFVLILPSASVCMCGCIAFFFSWSVSAVFYSCITHASLMLATENELLHMFVSELNISQH